MDDIPLIMEFIDKHWKKNHILARDRNFFEWMYVDKDGCNFILSFDKQGVLNGIEGYIKYNNSEYPDIAGTLWKVLKSDNPLLGMEIGSKMYEVTKARCDVAPGLTKRAVKINQVLGYLGGKLEHYYILGEQEEYNLAVVNGQAAVKRQFGNKQFVKISSINELKKIISDEEQRKKIPYKDTSYIIRRYMEHPIYSYEILGIENEQNIDCVIVGRMVEYKGAMAYKIIDIIGDFSQLMGTAQCFRDLIYENHYEYIDLYCVGVLEEYLLSAGFSKRTGDEVIIPNYFEPFERKNVDIYYAASLSEGLCVFRGDGDQDRPS